MSIKGWRGISTNRGKFVPAEDGFDYAAKAVGIKDFDPTAPEAEEFKAMLTEWYFSGNWLEVEHDDDD